MDLCRTSYAKNGFTKEAGAFGYTWARKFKSDEDALPSLNEVLSGLERYYAEQIDDMTSGQSKYRVRHAKY